MFPRDCVTCEIWLPMVTALLSEGCKFTLAKTSSDRKTFCPSISETGTRLQNGRMEENVVPEWDVRNYLSQTQFFVWKVGWGCGYLHPSSSLLSRGWWRRERFGGCLECWCPSLRAPRIPGWFNTDARVGYPLPHELWCEEGDNGVGKPSNWQSASRGEPFKV